MYGFISGLAMAILYLVLYLTGISFKPGVSYISYIPFLVGVILNAMAYSKANDGAVTFGNVFGSGFKASMIVTIVMIAWGFISMFIFPDMKEKALEAAREQMAKNPKVTDEQIEMTLNMTKKYFSVFMIAGMLFSNLFFGAIFSLVGAGVAKKNAVRPAGDNF